MRPIGKVNVIGLLLILAAGGGLYWIVLFGPIHIDNYTVKDAVSIAFNSYGNEGQNLVGIRKALRFKLDDPKLGPSVVTDSETGEQTEMTGLPIPDAQLITEFDEVTGVLTIRAEYERQVVLVPTDKVSVVHFVVERSGVPGRK